MQIAGTQVWNPQASHGWEIFTEHLCCHLGQGGKLLYLFSVELRRIFFLLLEDKILENFEGRLKIFIDLTAF